MCLTVHALHSSDVAIVLVPPVAWWVVVLRVYGSASVQLAPFASVNGVTFGYIQTDVRFHRDVLGHGCLPPSHSYRFVLDETNGQVMIVAPFPDGTLFAIWLCTVDPPAGAVGAAARPRRRRSMVLLSPPPFEGAIPAWILHRTDVEEEVVGRDPFVRPESVPPPQSATAASGGDGGRCDDVAPVDDMGGLPACPLAPTAVVPALSLVDDESPARGPAWRLSGTPATSLPDDAMAFLEPFDEGTADGLIASPLLFSPGPQVWPPSPLPAASASASSSSFHVAPTPPAEATVAAIPARRASTSPVDFNGFMDATLRVFSGLAIGQLHTTCNKRALLGSTDVATPTSVVGQSRTWWDQLPAAEVAALKAHLIQAALDAMAGWVPRPVWGAVAPVDCHAPSPGGLASLHAAGIGVNIARGPAPCRLTAVPSSSTPLPPLPPAAARDTGVGASAGRGRRRRAMGVDVVDVNSAAYRRQVRNRLAARRSNEQRRLRRLAVRTAAAAAAAAEVAAAASNGGGAACGGAASPDAAAAEAAAAEAAAAGATRPSGMGATAGRGGGGAAAAAWRGAAGDARQQGGAAAAATAGGTAAVGRGERGASG